MSIRTAVAPPSSEALEQLFVTELEAAGVHVCSVCRADLLTVCAIQLQRVVAEQSRTSAARAR